MAAGCHPSQARATVAGGNPGPPASPTGTTATAAPTASITSSPSNPSNSNAPSFSFSSEAGASFHCALDGAAFASCTSPKTYTSVADGSHTFHVKPTDGAGNTGTAATYTWTIATTAPVASIT